MLTVIRLQIFISSHVRAFRTLTILSVKNVTIIIIIHSFYDLYCVEWGVKLYSLTHWKLSPQLNITLHSTTQCT